MQNGEIIFVRSISINLRQPEDKLLTFYEPVMCHITGAKYGYLTVKPMKKIPYVQVKECKGKVPGADSRRKYLQSFQRTGFTVGKDDIASPLDMIKAKNDKRRNSIR